MRLPSICSTWKIVISNFFCWFIRVRIYVLTLYIGVHIYAECWIVDVNLYNISKNCVKLYSREPFLSQDEKREPFEWEVSSTTATALSLSKPLVYFLVVPFFSELYFLNTNLNFWRLQNLDILWHFSNYIFFRNIDNIESESQFLFHYVIQYYSSIFRLS